MESQKVFSTRGAREVYQALPYIAELSPLALGFLLVLEAESWHTGFLIVTGVAHLVAPFLRYSNWGRRQFEDSARFHASIASAVLMLLVLGGTLYSEFSRLGPPLLLATTLASTLLPNPLRAQSLTDSLWGAGGLALRSALFTPLGVLVAGQSPGQDIWLIGFLVGTVHLSWVLIRQRELFYRAGWSREEVVIGSAGEVRRPGRFTKAFGFLLTVGATLVSVAVALGRAPFEMAVAVLALLAGAKILNHFYEKLWSDEVTEERVCQLLVGTLVVLFIVVGSLR